MDVQTSPPSFNEITETSALITVAHETFKLVFVHKLSFANVIFPIMQRWKEYKNIVLK